MSLADLIGTGMIIAIGSIGPFLFMISIGLFGKWFPYRSNIILMRESRGYIVARRKMREIAPLQAWEIDQQDWLRSCMIAVFVMILIAIL